MLQLVMIAGVVAVAGTYMVTKIFAASASLSFVPVTATVNIGDNVTVQIRENSSTDTVNAVQANMTYDATKLQYVSVDETGSAFGLVAATTTSAGSLQFARGTSGGTAPVTGDQLVTTVTFKALAAGPVALTVATGSAVVRSTDSTDILAVKNGATLTLADTGAPTVPTGLAAPTLALSSIGLTWTAATDNVGVTNYAVFRNGTQVGTTAATNFTSTGLTPNTSYSFSVAALDAAGNTSAQSAAITAKTLADTAAPSVPGVPTSSTQTMNSIALTWMASTDNVAVAGYKLFRNGTQIASPTTTTYTDTNLTPNTSYSYTVAAVDSSNNTSAQSAAVSLKTLPDSIAPSVPTGLQGTVTGQSVALTWTAATDNVAVTGYIVYRDGVQVAAPTGLSYTDTAVSAGPHNYTVAAVDAAGNKSAQSTALAVTIAIVGDINRDGKVDIFDLSIMLASWSHTGVNTSDLNGDSIVNIFDLSILLAKWTG